jgi:hypothetical protein
VLAGIGCASSNADLTLGRPASIEQRDIPDVHAVAAPDNRLSVFAHVQAQCGPVWHACGPLRAIGPADVVVTAGGVTVTGRTDSAGTAVLDVGRISEAKSDPLNAVIQIVQDGVATATITASLEATSAYAPWKEKAALAAGAEATFASSEAPEPVPEACSKRALDPMAAARFPFFDDRIDFPRIEDWVCAYRRLIHGTQTERDDSRTVKKALGAAEFTAAVYGKSTQPLGESAADLAREIVSAFMSRSPTASPNGQFGLYLDNVSTVLTEAQSLLLSFKTEFYDALPASRRFDVDAQLQDLAANQRQLEVWRSQAHVGP